MPALSLQGGLLRRLYLPDLAGYVAHLLRLDAGTRHDRFGMAVSDAFLEKYAAGCFGPSDLVYGFFDAGGIRAAGELRQVDKSLFARNRAGEAAFSVEPGWRRKGIGTALMEKIVRAAQNRRDETLHMMCLAQNKAMQGLARKFAAELEFGRDEVTGRMIGQHVTPLSLMGEAMDDASGLLASLREARLRLAGAHRPGDFTAR